MEQDALCAEVLAHLLHTSVGHLIHHPLDDLHFMSNPLVPEARHHLSVADHTTLDAVDHVGHVGVRRPDEVDTLPWRDAE